MHPLPVWVWQVTGAAAVVGLCFAMRYFGEWGEKLTRELPPGPPEPGDGYFLKKNVGEALHNLKNTYGPVMSMQVEGETWVILNDYDSIVKGLAFKDDIFSGRPTKKRMIIGGIPGGIVLTDYGTHWKNWRIFGLLALQRFKGKKWSSAEIVAEEIPFLVERLTVKSTDTLRTKLSCAVSNLLSRIVIGERFSCKDKYHTLNLLLDKLSCSADECRYFSAISDLRHHLYNPDVAARIEKELHILQNYDDLFNDFVDEHQRDVDALFEEMKQRVPYDRDLREDNLRLLMKELIQMGTRITGAALRWMILALARHPDVQRKIFEEPLNILGESEVSWQEFVKQLPYTLSFVREVLRHRTPLTALLHKTNADCELHGYFISKNTTVVPNIWSVHHDPKLFDDPEEFRPERFIDGDGKFIRDHPHMIPYSIGSRQCIAMELASTSLLVFVAGIVKSVKIFPDPQKPLPAFEEGKRVGLIYDAPNFEALFELRN